MNNKSALSASSHTPVSRSLITISPVTWVLMATSILIGGYLYWFYTNFDKVIKDVDKGMSQEARSNPFFAAEKFLEAVGKKAKSQKNYSILNEKLHPYDTLIIESSRVGLTEGKRQRIKDWVASGGHLILLATEPYDDDLSNSRDMFLDELGVRLYDNTNYDWDATEEEQLSKFTFDAANFDDKEKETRVSFGYDYYLQDTSGDATFVGGNQSSDFFVQYDYDKGMVTVVTDLSIWHNYSIDNYDHAMFLYQLVGGAENVWFLYNTIQPSLLSSITELIPMVVISIIFLLIVILFSASWRKGIPKNDALRVQRQLMQHIQAAGEFSYRNDEGESLLSGLMVSLESKIKKSIPQYDRLELNKKIIKLAQLTGKDKNEIATLWQQEEKKQDDFIKKIILMKDLKKQLS